MQGVPKAEQHRPWCFWGCSGVQAWALSARTASTIIRNEHKTKEKRQEGQDEETERWWLWWTKRKPHRRGGDYRRTRIQRGRQGWATVTPALCSTSKERNSFRIEKPGGPTPAIHGFGIGKHKDLRAARICWRSALYDAIWCSTSTPVASTSAAATAAELDPKSVAGGAGPTAVAVLAQLYTASTTGRRPWSCTTPAPAAATTAVSATAATTARSSHPRNDHAAAACCFGIVAGQPSSWRSARITTWPKLPCIVRDEFQSWDDVQSARSHAARGTPICFRARRSEWLCVSDAFAAVFTSTS